MPTGEHSILNKLAVLPSRWLPSNWIKLNWISLFQIDKQQCNKNNNITKLRIGINARSYLENTICQINVNQQKVVLTKKKKRSTPAIRTNVWGSNETYLS